MQRTKGNTPKYKQHESKNQSDNHLDTVIFDIYDSSHEQILKRARHNMTIFIKSMLDFFKRNDAAIAKAQEEPKTKELILEFRELFQNSSVNSYDWIGVNEKIKTSIVGRLEWYRTLLECLYNNDFYKCKKESELSLFLNKLDVEVGSGSYGTVYKTKLLRNECSPFPVAVKKENYYESNSQLMCSYYANMLVMAVQVPYLTLTLPPLYIETGKHHDIVEYSIMELADTSLAHWFKNFELKEPSDVEEYFSLFFQIFWTIMVMAVQYQAVHNDLYARNILLNHVDVDTIKQSMQVDNTTYTYEVKAEDLMVKISDFGFCETPLFKKKFMTEGDDFVEYGKLSFTDIDSLNEHVIMFDLPRYARDILSVCSEFRKHFKTFKNLQHYGEVQMFAEYLEKFMNHVLKNIKTGRSGYLTKVKDLLDLFVYFFNHTTMGDELSNAIDWNVVIKNK